MFPSQYHLKIPHSVAFSTAATEPVFSLVYEHGTSIPTDGRGCTSFRPNLHPDHHAHCCISLSLHKAKTGWHFPPQLKGEAGTAYHNLQCTRHTTSIDVIYTNHLVIYTIIQQQEQKCSIFIRDTIFLIFSSQINFPIYETIISDIWNNENPSICLYLN